MKTSWTQPSRSVTPPLVSATSLNKYSSDSQVVPLTGYHCSRSSGAALSVLPVRWGPSSVTRPSVGPVSSRLRLSRPVAPRKKYPGGRDREGGPGVEDPNFTSTLPPPSVLTPRSLSGSLGTDRCVQGTGGAGPQGAPSRSGRADPGDLGTPLPPLGSEGVGRL